jgi:hypothetical protein
MFRAAGAPSGGPTPVEVLSEDNIVALNRLAQQFAREINAHDWSDAHSRADRAGHSRTNDKAPSAQLTDRETEVVRLNVMWVTAQVLMYNDPNLDVYEYAAACGVSRHWTHASGGRRSGIITAGIRYREAGVVGSPGRGTDAD